MKQQIGIIYGYSRGNTFDLTIQVTKKEAKAIAELLDKLRKPAPDKEVKK